MKYTIKLEVTDYGELCSIEYCLQKIIDKGIEIENFELDVEVLEIEKDD